MKAGRTRRFYLTVSPSVWSKDVAADADLIVASCTRRARCSPPTGGQRSGAAACLDHFAPDIRAFRSFLPHFMPRYPARCAEPNGLKRGDHRHGIGSMKRPQRSTSRTRGGLRVKTGLHRLGPRGAPCDLNCAGAWRSGSARTGAAAPRSQPARAHSPHRQLGVDVLATRSPGPETYRIFGLTRPRTRRARAVPGAHSSEIADGSGRGASHARNGRVVRDRHRIVHPRQRALPARPWRLGHRHHRPAGRDDRTVLDITARKRAEEALRESTTPRGPCLPPLRWRSPRSMPTARADRGTRRPRVCSDGPAAERSEAGAARPDEKALSTPTCEVG